MSHPLIDALAELNRVAAMEWWSSEDRSAWRDDILRQRESLELLSLKSYLFETPASEQNAASHLAQPEPATIPTWLWDADLLRCFFPEKYQQPDADLSTEEGSYFATVMARLDALAPATACALLLRPGFWMSEAWVSEEQILRESLERAREKKILTIRAGFLSEQSDILMSAELGFSGIQIHAADMDLFQLQLSIELARDCRLCPIVSVENFQQMEQVVQTDAPHIALCGLPGMGYDSTLRFIQKSMPNIPSNCTRVMLVGTLTASEKAVFAKMGAHCFLSFLP